jgi:SNF2 family DNA or RNA helicase
MAVSMDFSDLSTFRSLLWDHQFGALDFSAHHDGALWHMGMGSGKTRSALALAAWTHRQSDLPALVLCPKPCIYSVWADEARKVPFPSRVFVLDRGGKKRVDDLLRFSLAKGAIIVLNYEAAIQEPVLRELERIRWRLLVLDESQRIKNPNGRTAKAALRLAKVAKKRVCLSGTPAPHSPLDLFSQMRFLDESIFGASFTRFRAKYAEMGIRLPPSVPRDWRERLSSLGTRKQAAAAQLLGTKNFRSEFRKSLRDQLVAWCSGFSHRRDPFSERQWNAISGKVPLGAMMKVVGWKNKEEVQRLLSLVRYRVRTEDVLDLPEVSHVRRAVVLEPKALDIYQSMEKDFVSDLGSGAFASASHAITAMLRLQQITGGLIVGEDPDGVRVERVISTAKQEALQEILEEVDPQKKVVVFCRFRSDIERARFACADAEREAFRLMGGRNELEDWKKAGPGAVLISQIQAGGVGISMVEASVGVYYSMGFSLGDYEQSLARLHRPGQEAKVQYFHLVASGTIDEKVYQVLRKRKDLVESVLAEYQEKS